MKFCKKRFSLTFFWNRPAVLRIAEKTVGRGCDLGHAAPPACDLRTKALSLPSALARRASARRKTHAAGSARLSETRRLPKRALPLTTMAQLGSHGGHPAKKKRWFDHRFASPLSRTFRRRSSRAGGRCPRCAPTRLIPPPRPPFFPRSSWMPMM